MNCGVEKAEKKFALNALYTGLNNFEAFKLDKRDSLKFIPPPPPPFQEEIGVNNIIENLDGRIYLYSFSLKNVARSCIREDDYEESVYEIFMDDLDTLQARNLKELTYDNIDSIIAQFHFAKEMGIFVSIGLQNDSTSNQLLVNFVNKLYHDSKNNVWKVRRINNKEEKLLNQRSGTSS